MIAAIHQPNFLPWLGFFDKLTKCDVFILLDDVQFSKGSWINRVKIRDKEKWRWLTAPVLTKHNLKTNIKEIEINLKINWAQKHLNTLKTYYGAADYFKEHFNLIESIYKKNYETLLELNIDFLRTICEIMDFKDKFVFSSSLGAKNEEPRPEGVASSQRGKFIQMSPFRRLSDKSTDLLIKLAKEVKADTYLSGDGSAEYLEEEKFKNAEIKLVYQNFKYPLYKQTSLEFIPGLSIIDALFNVGRENLRKIMKA